MNRDDTTATDAGAVFLLYLQKDVEAPITSWRKVTSGLGGFNIRLQAMDYFGASVAGIGDVDGDGMEDMVVGALGDDEAALNAGPYVRARWMAPPPLSLWVYSKCICACICVRVCM